MKYIVKVVTTVTYAWVITLGDGEDLNEAIEADMAHAGKLDPLFDSMEIVSTDTAEVTE